MKISFVTPAIPNDTSDTHSICCLLMVRALKNAGHDVAVIAQPKETDLQSDSGEILRQQAAALRRELISVDLVPTPPPPPAPLSLMPYFNMRIRHKICKPYYWLARLRAVIAPTMFDLFPETTTGKSLAQTLQRHDPDIVVFWTIYAYAISALDHIKFPRVIILGDPPAATTAARQIPPFVPWRHLLSRNAIWWLWRAYQYHRFTITRLRREKHLFNAVHGYTMRFRKQGLPQMNFLRNLAPDIGGTDWRHEREVKEQGRVFRIMLLGDLNTTVNSVGLRYFSKAVYPALKKVMLSEYEIHICGSGTPPHDIAAELSAPNVYFRGFVDDLREELFLADVLLVPTPIKLGGRVRITYAWSTGICVIAHEANAFGLVEMQHQKNALLGGTAQEIAQSIAKVYEDKEYMRQIQNNGRLTFEEFYADPRWEREFVKIIEDAAIDSSRQ